MQILDTKSAIVVHLEEGDEVVESLRNFARDKGLDAAYISGIGTTSKVELGFFDKEVKRYQLVEFEEDMEMVTVTGNISRFGDDYVVHLHGIFGDDEFTTYGGHVMSAEILATGEFFVFPLDARIERSPNEKFELNLFDLKK